jgi:prepilin-type N-terminal cleavage/methylation domain-containing protein
LGAAGARGAVRGRRGGHTLIEIAIALAIMAILLSMAAPRLGTLRDRASVRSATTEIVAVLSSARRVAMLRSSSTMVVIDEARSVASIIVAADTVLAHDVGSELGVTITATRDTILYGPSGRGWGASNTSIVLARGEWADTVFVSRLGRVRKALIRRSPAGWDAP